MVTGFWYKRMASNASRGQRAKERSKKWLERRGYTVGYLERVRFIFRGGRPIPRKQDQFASDLLALGHDTVLFVQVKSGDSARGGTFPAARRAFGAFRFPAACRLLIMAWPPGARVPRLVEVEHNGEFGEYQAQ